MEVFFPLLQLGCLFLDGDLILCQSQTINFISNNIECAVKLYMVIDYELVYNVLLHLIFSLVCQCLLACCSLNQISQRGRCLKGNYVSIHIMKAGRCLKQTVKINASVDGKAAACVVSIMSLWDDNACVWFGASSRLLTGATG